MRVHNQKKKMSQDPKIVRFLITYFMLLGIVFIIVTFIALKEYSVVDIAYSNFIVFVTHNILSLFQIQSSYQGTIIGLPNVSLNVRYGCNGLEAVLIYSVAILAFPAPWRKKLIGILGGLLIIQVINIIRIVCLSYVAINHRELFKILHTYVAQGSMIAIALGIFLVYLNYATREKQLDN